MYLILAFIVSRAAKSEGGIIFQPGAGAQFTYTESPIRFVNPIPTLSSYKTVEDVPEKIVSYSIPYRDNLYLQKHKIEGKDSPFEPDLIEDSFDYKHQNIHNHHNVEHKEGHTNLVPIKTKTTKSDVLKRSTTRDVVVTQNIPAINIQTPIVSKHIYFHVPPPEFEDQPVIPVALLPKKKHYKIIFIKTPSQEPNYSRLKQILQTVPPVEEKTLIYVLSKKQELQLPVVLEPKLLSPPEVYYVNYKVNPRDVTKINSELGEISLLQNLYPL